MTDIVERARSPEFADVAEKYLLAECAAEIERLHAALDTTQALMTANYDAGRRAGLARAAAITVCDACEETIRAELSRPVRKEE